MSDEQLAGAAEIRNEMSKVNSGSKREAELQQELNSLYQRHAATRQAPVDTAPAPRPDGYPGYPTTDAEANAATDLLAQIEDELSMFGITTARRTLLEQKRDDLLRQDYEAQKSLGVEPETITPASVRPELRGGATWDEEVVGRFEQQAPGARVLEHIVADAHNARERWDDVDAAVKALEANHGIEDTKQLADDARAYLREYDKDGKIELSLKAQGQFYNPKLIVAAAQWWRRQHGTGP